MNTSKLSLIFRGAVFLSLMAAFAGCQSQVQTQPTALTSGASTVQSIEAAADKVQSGIGQINRMLAALRNLTERPSDIPAQYAVVQEQFAALKATATEVSALADEMRTKGDAYLADWARQVAVIRDAELRGAAFDRRAETSARLQEIFQGYQKVKADYAAFQTHLGDIQAALGVDLSAAGLEAIKPFVAKATAAAEPLKASLQELTDDFRAAGLSMQPGKS